MATYVKKKRGILGKFSGFPDEPLKSAGEECSGYTRLEKVKSAMKPSWTRPGDESVDTPASKNLLGGRSFGRHTSISSEPGVQSRASSMSTTPTDLIRFQSCVTVPEPAGMPVPSVPQCTHAFNAEQHGSLPTRQPKPSRNGKKEHVRPVISAPILISPGPQIRTRPIISSPIVPDSSILQTGILSDENGARSQGLTVSQFSMAQAEAMTYKIDMLTTQFKASQAENNLQIVKNANMEKHSRLWPLQRGKAALAKATRAIAIRMNGNNSNGVEEQAVPDLDNSPTRIDLRKAEGMNLGKEKVQALLGDGFVKRKPLPGTKTERSPTPEIEDPLADAKLAAIPAMGTADFSGFNFDFMPNSAQRNSTYGASSFQRNSISMSFAAGNPQAESPSRFTPSSGRSYLEEPAEPESSSSSPVNFSTPLVESSAPSEFSSSVSGLEQHPNVLTFANPPIDVSPPRIRLEPKRNLSKQRRSRAVLTQELPIAKTDFQNEGDADAAFVTTRSRPNTLCSNSVKRKSAMIELRSNHSTMKRTKRDSISSYELKEEEEAGLIKGIGQLDTEERRALLPKDKNLEIKPREQHSLNAKGGPKRGLAMYDTSKCKEPMTNGEDEKSRLPQRHTAMSKRSAIPGPIAGFYSYAMRVNRAYDRNIDNPMDVDE